MDHSADSGSERTEVRAQYDWGTTSPSEAVVDAVADAVTGGPTSFGPLYDRIDPDALDSIFRADREGEPADDTRVSFSLAGHLVVVHGAGDVVVKTTA
ncbi:HalOD1 output domain-containing protein [Halorubrum sp. 2020YC2]|uniref:HalOD1 output domain-containing protein n=1 Tax=Halorubrum sp. 2020YC2 TaxID=2836432 RepID=UPI001BECAFA0|nr:HalOD1 output domain-containing protein [Halorubrum sp. 2020YC2]QWC20195.1 hypothetical protein KI388_04385 [Halorubrum sp. 2020YC2]